jgi:6-phosphogluconolactonase
MRFLTHKWPRAVLLALVTSVVVAAPAAATGSKVIGHVYVNDNTVGANTIGAFDRHADGTLTAVSGSPFAAGGSGSGAGLASQGALQVTADGRYLLAVDAGSSQVSVLRIKPDGAVRLVRHGVVASGGLKPVSVADHDGLVYVANAGDGGADYTGFRLTFGGHLRPIASSTISLPDGSQPGDVLFNSIGTNLVGTRVGSSLIDSFSVGRDGRLTAASGSPFAAQGPGPFGSEFRPTNPSQLYVSNAHGAADAGTVSAFWVSHHGTLTSIGSSPFADQQTAPCWVEISHDGRYLFTVNTASASVSRYVIRDDGTLTLIGSTPLHDPLSLGAEDADLSPDGRTLWVVDGARGAVSGFTVHGDDLTELSSSPTSLPTGAAPSGIVVQ